MRNGMIIDEYDTQYWYVNDQLHRIDGPAIISAGGSQSWWVDGKRHRSDGPAIIDTSGTEWWINNIYITNDDVDKWMTDLDIFYPFDEEYQTLFVLTFGGK